MSVRTTRVRPDALRRRCVACGYDGPELSGPGIGSTDESPRASLALADASDPDGRSPSCPGCGCDFAVRPPRSYAEMEGLEVPVGARLLARGLRPPPVPVAVPRGPSLVVRWVVFLGIVLAGFVLGWALLAASWPA